MFFATRITHSSCKPFRVTADR